MIAPVLKSRVRASDAPRARSEWASCGALVLTLAGSQLASVGHDVGGAAPGAAAAACSSLQGKTFDNVNVPAAVPVPASGALPAYCKVGGTETGTEHDIEVRLPEGWTHRLVQQGGGGFDGSIQPVGTTNAALRTWNQVADAAGGAIADANARLYIASGVGHCRGALARIPSIC